MSTSTTENHSTKALEIHRRAIIVDGHCDTPYRLHRHGLHLEDADPTAQVDLKSLQESGITASFFAAYVPGYRLKHAVQFDAIAEGTPVHTLLPAGSPPVTHKVSVFLEVEGAAHYLPAYAGNLDIMTSAALRTAESIAARLAAREAIA